jgi:hypothetical protein
MDTNRLHRDTNALLAAPIMQAHIYSSEEKHIREKTKGIEKNIYLRGEQIPGAGPPRRLNYVEWRPIFINFQFGTSFISHFWRTEF